MMKASQNVLNHVEDHFFQVPTQVCLRNIMCDDWTKGGWWIVCVCERDSRSERTRVVEQVANPDCLSNSYQFEDYLLKIWIFFFFAKYLRFKYVLVLNLWPLSNWFLTFQLCQIGPQAFNLVSKWSLPLSVGWKILTWLTVFFFFFFKY